jgi:hypothetical protein
VKYYSEKLESLIVEQNFSRNDKKIYNTDRKEWRLDLQHTQEIYLAKGMRRLRLFAAMHSVKRSS